MFPDIDWTRPWYDTVRPAFDSLQPGPFIPAFNANAARLGLVNDQGEPIRFVPQADLPEGVAYEAFIGATGCVPTRHAGADCPAGRADRAGGRRQIARAGARRRHHLR